MYKTELLGRINALKASLEDIQTELDELQAIYDEEFGEDPAQTKLF